MCFTKKLSLPLPSYFLVVTPLMLIIVFLLSFAPHSCLPLSRLRLYMCMLSGTILLAFGYSSHSSLCSLLPLSRLRLHPFVEVNVRVSGHE
ncbi:hypothetical protein Fmac_020888 [Flemingia macrophylla]|uniref:Uncharacterized protein n=1 Tax=Flemingia macrophylla TaxID=520843 RepID=A0ABD1LVC6_9FABA